MSSNNISVVSDLESARGFLSSEPNVTSILVSADANNCNILMWGLDDQDKVLSVARPNLGSGAVNNLLNDYRNLRWNCTKSLGSELEIEAQLPEGLDYHTLGADEVETVFEEPKKLKAKTGRHGDVSVGTARQVYLESYNRCMFEGCAKDLREHNTTGDVGNFGYLAHIVPASTNGPRGGEPGIDAERCERLADKPSNIMYLCDECHRLVDKVAVAEYSVERLNRMREIYVSAADAQLEALAFEPATTLQFIWPINRNLLSPPSIKQRQGCFAVNGLRDNTQPLDISDTNGVIRDNKVASFWQGYALIALNSALIYIESSVKKGLPIGLFAAGPMPALIALGSLCGNKSNITPMPLSRTFGGWKWLRDEPTYDIYNIHESYVGGETELVVQIAFTNEPSELVEFSSQLQTELECGLVTVQAKFMSNESIAHPDEALELQNDLTRLFQRMKSDKGINRVHLLICASNLVSVHVGMAIEQICPEVIVYDFLDVDGETSLYPTLKITPSNEGGQISYAG